MAEGQVYLMLTRAHVWAAQQREEQKAQEPEATPSRGVSTADTAQSSSTLAPVLGISNAGTGCQPAVEAALNHIHTRAKGKALTEGSVS